MTPMFSVFPVLSVSVMEKCYDACGDGENFFRLCFSAFRGYGVSGALLSTGNTSGRVFRRYRVTVFEKHRLPKTGSR
jgi:hypothetical protein